MKTRIVAALAVAALSVAACAGSKSSNANASSSPASAMAGAGSGQMAAPAAGSGTPPDCGAVQAVWVNLNSRVYHLPSDPVYGKTKHGEYLCPAQAKAQGFRPAGGSERHKHMRGSSSSSM
jgi:hypothetical protein